jgi:hypothetical protein
MQHVISQGTPQAAQGSHVSQYRLYTLNKRGRLFGPAHVIEAATDDEAAAQAKRFQTRLIKNSGTATGSF